MIGPLSKLSVRMLTLAVLSVASPAMADDLTASKDIFTSHRALYQMDLGRALQSANISSASGTMFYRFEALCEGWGSRVTGLDAAWLQC